MGPLRTLIDADQFQAGLTAGAVVALVLAVFLVVPRIEARQERRSPPRPPLGGVLFVVASLVALHGAFGFAPVAEVPGELEWGLVLLVVGVEIGDRLPWPWLCRPLVALVGAWLVAFRTGVPGDGWVPWVVFAGTVLAATLAADVDRRMVRLGAGPALFGIAVVGVYATVPDTESARVLIGAALPIALLGVPVALARMGAGGMAGATALLLWVAAFEGIGRAGSVVGAAGSLGLLVLEPIGHRFAIDARFGPLARASWRKAQIVLLLGQVAVVAYASRVAGFEQHGVDAALLLLPIVVVGILFGAAFAVPERMLRRPVTAGDVERSRARRRGA